MKTKRWMDTGRREEPGIIVYRNIFRTEKSCRMELTYSADERAQFFLDGEYIGNGPERGCPDRWYSGTLVLELTSGEHALTARVLQFGEKMTAHGQMSVRHGLYIDNTDGVLSADWTFQREDGLTFAERWPDWGTFPKVILQKEYNCGILKGRGGEWAPVHWFDDDRQLYPPDLPSMRFEPVVPEKTAGGAKKFTAYTCAWCVYRFTGHGKVLIRWMEAPYIENYLYDHPNLKGHKGRRDGTFFIADNDEFEIDGELEWYDYWWKTGHYTEIEVVSGNVEVSARYYRTGYPLPEFRSDDPLKRAAYETLQNCSFETIMDCPYYEQMAYLGDGRIESRCIYALGNDFRLPEKTMRQFAAAQLPDGTLPARYPSKVVQLIPSFMLNFIYMLYEYREAGGRKEFLTEMLPTALRLGTFLENNLKDNLLYLPGWNFIDWHPAWPDGMPPGCRNGSTSSILNWMTVLALRELAELTDDNHWLDVATRIKTTIFQRFYIDKEKIFADDFEHKSFSEHAQVMALLAAPDETRQVLDSLRRDDLIPCSISFSVNYFDVCRKFRLEDLRSKRLARYTELLDKGLTTLPEEFENPRSDCHAWSSHILFS